jgi:uncharacterized protein YifN (PemK superfamily)
VPPDDIIQARIRQVKPLLARTRGVVGIGQGQLNGTPCLVVMLSKDDEQTRKVVEKIAKDIPHKIQVTGQFKALRSK